MKHIQKTLEIALCVGNVLEKKTDTHKKLSLENKEIIIYVI